MLLFLDESLQSNCINKIMQLEKVKYFSLFPFSLCHSLLLHQQLLIHQTSQRERKWSACPKSQSTFYSTVTMRSVVTIAGSY